MRINFKNYKIKKTKSYIKKNAPYFFLQGPNRNTKTWLLTQQTLKMINFTYYKIFNKTSKKIINKSIYKNIKETINGITFLVKPKASKMLKEVLITHFDALLFNVLTVKLNNQFYQLARIKNNYCLSYKNAKKLLFQFKVTGLKKSR